MTTRSILYFYCLAIATIFWIPSLSLAADGALEINESCAVQTGCFAGDAIGYPVTISQPGSYVLSSNLVISDVNQTAILVSADQVSIDLNDFAIIQSTCVGATLSCRPTTGAGTGIDVDDITSRSGLTIQGGSIVGMGLNGVRLGIASKVQNMRIRWNRLNGIAGQNGIQVMNSVVARNGGVGIRITNSLTALDNVLHENGGDGIECGGGSSVSGNAVFENGAFGIQAGIGSTVSGNGVKQNGSDGINASIGSTITLNSSHSNGGDGIQASNDALVQRNTISENGGFGLQLAADAAYRENVATDNTSGNVSGGVNLGDNLCTVIATSTSCP